jgi:hypothetical protein
VVAFDANDHAARARVRVRDDSVQVVACTVEPRAPHRIRSTRTTALAPRVPDSAVASRFQRFLTASRRGAGTRLIVFSGLPGTGKSTLAEATGRQLGIPVIRGGLAARVTDAIGGYRLDRLPDISVEMLTTLAFRQRELGQSAILDHPA